MSDAGTDAKLTTSSTCPLSVLTVPSHPVVSTSGAGSCVGGGIVAAVAVAPILLSSGPDLMSCSLRSQSDDADDAAQRAEDDEPQRRRQQQQQQQRRRRRRRQRTAPLPRFAVASESLQHTEPNRCSFWQRYSNILRPQQPISSSSRQLRSRRPLDRLTQRRQRRRRRRQPQPSCATAVVQPCSRGHQQQQQQPTVALISSSSSNNNTTVKRPTPFCCTVAA